MILKPVHYPRLKLAQRGLCETERSTRGVLKSMQRGNPHKGKFVWRKNPYEGKSTRRGNPRGVLEVRAMGKFV